MKDNDGDSPFDLALRTQNSVIIDLFGDISIKEPDCD
jgi:hypothetical protein